MTTSSFITLAGGGEVRFDFSAPDETGASSLAYQVLTADGHNVGPEVLAFPEHGIDQAHQVDAFGAAALSGGGFVLAVEERTRTIIGPHVETETLKVLVKGPNGEEVLQLGAGSGLEAGSTVGSPGVFGLSGDSFAVVFESHGFRVSQHLALPGADHELIDIELPSAVNRVSTANGDLALGFVGGGQLLAGGGAKSVLNGGDGFDTIVAGRGGDVIRAGDGADSVLGGASFSDINGNKGDDTIAGGSGGEILRGGQGNDVLSGGGGDDWLSGDRGTDTITGGGGADVFHASAGAGIDVVTDFDAAEGDRVMLDQGSSFTLTQSGADVVVQINLAADGFGELILKNTQLADLPAGFIFFG